MAGRGIIGRLLVKLGLDNSQFLQALEQSKAQTGSVTSIMGGLFTKLGGMIAAAFSVKAIVRFLDESTRLAGITQGVKEAFDRLNQPNLLNNLKEATKGTVDELKLMETAVRAKNFKIPLDNLASYLKFATQRAKEAGENVDYLVQSIVLGIGRKSPMILDNLGISAIEIREEFKKTGDMAKAVANIIDREMVDAGDSVETMADKAQKANASWKNFMATLGKTKAISWVKNEFLGLKQTFADVWSSDLSFFDKLGATFVPGGLAAQAAELNYQKILKSISDNRKRQELSDKVDNNMSSIKSLVDAEEALMVARQMLAKSDSDFYRLWEAKLKSYIETVKEAERREKSLAGLKESIEEKQREFDEETDPQKRQEIANEINRLNSQKKAIEDLTSEKEKSNKIKPFSESQKELAASLAALEKQRDAYGDTLVFLEEELKLKRQLEQFAKSDAERLKIKAENDELEKQIKLRKEQPAYEIGSEADLKAQLSAAEKELENINTTAIEGKERFRELSQTIDTLKQKIESLPQNYKVNINFSGELDDLLADTEATIDSLMEPWNKIQERNKRFNDEFNQTLQNGAIAGLTGLASTIGALASQNTDQIWSMLLNPIADMAIQLGSLAISTGIAIDGIKKAFESLNPYVAIAAGIALVALGTAVKGAIGNIGKRGGGYAQSPNTFTGGGGYSNAGALPDSAFKGQQQVQVTGSFRLDGRDLVASIDKTAQYNSR